MGSLLARAAAAGAADPGRARSSPSASLPARCSTSSPGSATSAWSAYPSRGCCSASSSTPTCCSSAGATSVGPRPTSATSPTSSRRSSGDTRSNAAPGIVAVTLVTLATLAIGTWGLRFSRTTSDFFVASRTVRPGLNAVRDRRRVPLRRLLPRRRRAAVHLRRRHALVPGRLDRRLPRAAGPGRRAAAPLRRLHAARLRRGPARVGAGARRLLAAGGRDRLALPAAAVPGRERHPHRHHRRPATGWAR